MEFKARLPFEAGAVEVWIVGEDGGWQIADAQGEQASSRRFGVKPGAGSHAPGA